MPSKQTGLQDLLVSEDDVNEEVLTGTIEPYVCIGKESGSFIPTEKFHQLPANAQTIVALLHLKATFELDLGEHEKATPLEISKTTGLNHNTVKGAVRDLLDADLVDNKDGKYWVPTYNYQKAQNFIEGKDD